MYVSYELTHFVGRGRPQEEQFQTMLRILESCTLLPGGKRWGGHAMWATVGGGRLCTNEMFTSQVVCFCDIPPASLRIHMAKYSEFGIAFRKSWLVGRGANPVFYLAAGDSPLETLDDGPPLLRADEFGRRVDECYRLLYEFEDFLDEHASQVPEEAERLHDGFHHLVNFFLQYRVFSYLKCFDPMLRDEHIDNFYMEREWRVYGPVDFELPDVSRVIVPASFRERIVGAIPAIASKVSVSEDLGGADRIRDAR